MEAREKMSGKSREEKPGGRGNEARSSVPGEKTKDGKSGYGGNRHEEGRDPTSCAGSLEKKGVCAENRERKKAKGANDGCGDENRGGGDSRAEILKGRGDDGSEPLEVVNTKNHGSLGEGGHVLKRLKRRALRYQKDASEREKQVSKCSLRLRVCRI